MIKNINTPATISCISSEYVTALFPQCLKNEIFSVFFTRLLPIPRILKNRYYMSMNVFLEITSIV